MKESELLQIIAISKDVIFKKKSLKEIFKRVSKLSIFHSSIKRESLKE